MFADMQDDDWGGDSATADAWTPTGASTSDAALETLLQQVELQPAAAATTAKPKQHRGKQAIEAAPAPAAAASGGIELGFVGPCEDEWVLPNQFPSKVGGQPVWLHPAALGAPPPSFDAEAERALSSGLLAEAQLDALTDAIASGARSEMDVATELRALTGSQAAAPEQQQHAPICGACSRPMRFLLQFYCPRPELPHAFHRSLMLFCCGGRCLATPQGWRALRCNLPEDTPYYRPQSDGSYVAHGRELLAPPPLPPPTRPLLPQLWLSVGIEGDWRGWLSWYDASEEGRVAAMLQRYKEEELHGEGAGAGAAEGGGGGGGSGGAAAMAVEMAAGGEAEAGDVWDGGEAGSEAPSDAAVSATDDEDDDDDDEGFDQFQRRVSCWPEQVLRLGGARPLWMGKRGRAARPPPACERCGAPRAFEFQLMPQLLCSLESDDDFEAMAAAAQQAQGAHRRDVSEALDTLDWGTVAVYTCTASCAAPDGASAYAEEVCWHQPVE